MPSEHLYHPETDLIDEHSPKTLNSEDLKMDSPSHFQQVEDNNLQLSPPSMIKAEANDPFMKPTSAQLDFSGLTTSCSGFSNSSQLDSLDYMIQDGVSSMSGTIRETLRHPLESQLMVQTHDEVASISSYSSVSSPEILSPSHSGITSPETLFQDTNTQLSLIQHAEDLNLHAEATNLDFINYVQQTDTNSETPRKVLKTEEQSDASTSTGNSEEAVPIVTAFDASSAISSSQFIFAQFGADVPGYIRFTSPAATTNSGNSTSTSAALSASPISVTAQQPQKKLKLPSLNLTFPAKHDTYELKILAQPEEQHRARYMTEGSRGSVKDTSGQGHPVVKLFGYAKKAKLQVFVGADTGRVKPHGFYQACKVSGKNSTNCDERSIEGTTVIEMDLEPEQDMKLSIDCVGILKLRNADVEQRIGVVRSKKKSTKARLVFRVCLPKPDGSTLTLQVASTPVLCTQPIGQPEICKKSLKEAPVTGGEELFIIGKNFMKGTKVVFRETASENSKDVVWEKVAEIDNEFFQQTHLICHVPKYDRVMSADPVTVSIVLECGGRLSDPHSFTYTPVSDFNSSNASPAGQVDNLELKQEPSNTPMEVETEVPITKSLSFVSPVALELNKLIQEQQQDDGIFKIPAGVGLPVSTDQITIQDSEARSSPTIKTESRSILYMDTTSAPEQSSISANAPMLTSLLVKEAESIQVAALPMQEQSDAQVPPQSLQQQNGIQIEAQQMLQQNPIGLEAQQFLQQSTIGVEAQQILQENTIQVEAQAMFQQNAIGIEGQHVQQTTNQVEARPMFQQNAIGIEAQHIQQNTNQVEAQPMFQQNAIGVEAQHIQQNTNQVDAQPMFQQNAISIEAQHIQQTTNQVEAQPMFQQNAIGIEAQHIQQNANQVDAQPMFQQNAVGIEQTTNHVEAQPLLQQNTIGTDAQQLLQQNVSQAPVQPMPQQTSMQVTSPPMQEQSQNVIQITSQGMQLSSAFQFGSQPIQQQSTIQVVPQSGQNTIQMVQSPTTIHVVSQGLQQTAAIQVVPQNTTQVVPQTLSQPDTIQVVDQTLQQQSIQQASQTIDDMVSKRQQDDTLQQAVQQQTSGTLQLLADAGQNVLPSISIEDVVDILTNNTS